VRSHCQNGRDLILGFGTGLAKPDNRAYARAYHSEFSGTFCWCPFSLDIASTLPAYWRSSANMRAHLVRQNSDAAMEKS
jgi:hypothetical protein